ncbi:MAG TPA: 6-carboxytetrahydropterin synthase QueD [bacterium]|nr:6-carboxytetrahydropterin synthase QueD [bacterium]HPN43300.1 6-carboxytetrahydropterin synthase QueD [bacterium]
MYKLVVESFFSAAHHLVEYPGACRRIHGHNWVVKATIAASILDESGMVMDLFTLKAILDDCLNQFDHRLINETPPFDTVNPTSENLAKYIYDYMKKQLPQGINMHQVEVCETEKFSVIYSE